VTGSICSFWLRLGVEGCTEIIAAVAAAHDLKAVVEVLNRDEIRSALLSLLLAQVFFLAPNAYLPTPNLYLLTTSIP
jgi:hypothetical protein